MSFLFLAGHLGADPEIRVTKTGKKVTILRVAVKSGKDETIWYRATIWEDRFQGMMSFLKKGSAVMIWGELKKPEIFTDREGKPQVSLEVTVSHMSFPPFGGGKPQNESHGGAPAASHVEQASPYTSRPSPSPMHETIDDEVPF
jgi:single-strand DNA-binding protein